ncbi:hypothetical protein R6Q59_019715 [Mikania micrantha]
MPLSPVASAQNRSFGPDIQLAESSLYPSSSSVAHSFSANSLGQAQFDSSSNMGAFYSVPHRGQMRLQSRRSQSREDLNCSIADAHLVKNRVRISDSTMLVENGESSYRAPNSLRSTSGTEFHVLLRSISKT